MSIIHRVSPTGPAEAAYAAIASISYEPLASPLTLTCPISQSWALVDKYNDPVHALDLSGQDYRHFDIQDYSPDFYSLDLSNNESLFIPPKTLITLLNLPLKSLFLHGINNGQEAVMNQILTYPSSIFHETLSTLDLSGYSIDNKQLKLLVSILPKLKKLGMHSSKLSNYALNTLLKTYASQLKYIDASNNQITQLTMLESWTPLPEKLPSPKKLSKQFSFSHLSTSPETWVVNFDHHQIFQPPIQPDHPSFLLDLRNNPLSSDTLAALKLRFDQVFYEMPDSVFTVFYNTQTQTYILTDLPKPESPSWVKV